MVFVSVILPRLLAGDLDVINQWLVLLSEKVPQTVTEYISEICSDNSFAVNIS